MDTCYDLNVFEDFTPSSVIHTDSPDPKVGAVSFQEPLTKVRGGSSVRVRSQGLRDGHPLFYFRGYG